MLSNRVDLTRNRDFGTRGLFNNSNGMTGMFFKRARVLSNNVMMSIDEYENIVVYEQFFGKIMRDESFDFFAHDKEKRYAESLKTTCLRCGKPLTVPWKSFCGLCKDCYDDTGERIPWRKKNTRDRRIDDRNDILYTR